MKKTKEIVLYDDTENYKKFDETRDFLFAVYADENGWACKENIPDETVYKEIDFQNAETWRDLKDALENSFKTRYYLMMGTCGRWNGNFDGVMGIHDLEVHNYGPNKFYASVHVEVDSAVDVMASHELIDNIKVIDRNGHLIIEGYHHDGSDHYELKRLTRQGYEYADRNYFAHDRKLHSTIMNCNFFSALPRIAQRVYGL